MVLLVLPRRPQRSSTTDREAEHEAAGAPETSASSSTPTRSVSSMMMRKPTTTIMMRKETSPLEVEDDDNNDDERQHQQSHYSEHDTSTGTTASTVTNSGRVVMRRIRQSLLRARTTTPKPSDEEQPAKVVETSFLSPSLPSSPLRNIRKKKKKDERQNKSNSDEKRKPVVNVIASYTIPEEGESRNKELENDDNDQQEEVKPLQQPLDERTTTPSNSNDLVVCESATAILQHSFWWCGSNQAAGASYDPSLPPQQQSQQQQQSPPTSGRRPRHSRSRSRLPDDPTVQESIECIFASQLQAGLPHLLLWDESSEENDDESLAEAQPERRAPTAPSMWQQSLLRNRSSALWKPGALSATATLQPNQSQQQQQQQSSDRPEGEENAHDDDHDIVHIQRHESVSYLGTFDPSLEVSLCDDVDEKLQGAHAHRNVPQTGVTATKVPSTSTATTMSPCLCRQDLPTTRSDWPQAPLLLRPGKGTRIKGVRFSSRTDYLWTPFHQNDANHSISTTTTCATWQEALVRHWNETNRSITTTNIAGATSTPSNPLTRRTCSSCCTLPINNGNEPPGEALVTDFETDLFVGTLLLRIRHCEGTTPEPYDDTKGYFCGMNRRYQAVIRGSFRTALPLTECVTGFRMDRPCGKLPPKWIVKSALKVVSFFAPQLQARLDGRHPICLTPLGSTPQSVIVTDRATTNDDDNNNNNCGADKYAVAGDSTAIDLCLDMESPTLQEPISAHQTLLGEACPSSSNASASSTSSASSMQRARFRKKAFDKLYTAHSPTPLADPHKVYTFEFLQHLVNFHDFSIELGSVMGNLSLKDMLDGQPLQIMAQWDHGRNTRGTTAAESSSSSSAVSKDDLSSSMNLMPLWSFDIWHQELVPDALKHVHNTDLANVKKNDNYDDEKKE